MVCYICPFSNRSAHRDTEHRRHNRLSPKASAPSQSSSTQALPHFELDAPSYEWDERRLKGKVRIF